MTIQGRGAGMSRRNNGYTRIVANASPTSGLKASDRPASPMILSGSGKQRRLTGANTAPYVPGVQPTASEVTGVGPARPAAQRVNRRNE